MTGLAAPPGFRLPRLRFNALVLIITDHCNLSCSHCYPECGPDRTAGTRVERFKAVIDQVAVRAEVRPALHLAGGEPTLLMPELCALVEHGRARGFSCSVVTNGWWGRTPDFAEQTVRRLAAAGVERVELSVDAFHQERLPIASARNALLALRAAGLEVNLRVCTTLRQTAAMALAGLDALDLAGVAGAFGPVIPVGRAARVVPREEWVAASEWPPGACANALNLTVRPSGNLSPCCAGSDLSPALSLGNAFDRPVAELLERSQRNVLVRTLTSLGPARLAALLPEELRARLPGPFASACHLCSQLTKDEELTACVVRALIGRLAGPTASPRAP